MEGHGLDFHNQEFTFVRSHELDSHLVNVYALVLESHYTENK